MNLRKISCGYVPLTDAAPLIIAHELGYAREEGFALDLVKHRSWASLRDMLAFGEVDAAHLLSPLPVAMSLGLSGLEVDIDALMVMSVNGNVIGATPELTDAMRRAGWDGAFQTAAATAKALRASKGPALRFGVPFPHSMHALLVDYWLGKPQPGERAIEVTTVPPPLMAEAMALGEVDAFCVGEPWGSLAVEQGHGRLILPGTAIWQAAPEKVLAIRRDWGRENAGLTGALMRAMMRAARWLDGPENRIIATEILSRSDYLGLSVPVLDRALQGRMVTEPGGPEQVVPNFLRFFRGAANFPWRSQGAWIGDRLAARAGIDSVAAQAVGRACFRSDLYRANLVDTGIDMPGASAKVEGALPVPTPVASSRGGMILGPDSFFDGQSFDPGKL